MWNNSDGKTIVNWKVQPARNTENLLEMASGLANDGKTNANGLPNILLNSDTQNVLLPLNSSEDKEINLSSVFLELYKTASNKN
jgi:hypothetical protein